MGIKDAAVMQQGPPSTPPPATSAAAGSVFRVLYMIYSSYLSGPVSLLVPRHTRDALFQLLCDLRANSLKDGRFLMRHARALMPHTAHGWLALGSVLGFSLCGIAFLACTALVLTIVGISALTGLILATGMLIGSILSVLAFGLFGIALMSGAATLSLFMAYTAIASSLAFFRLAARWLLRPGLTQIATSKLKGQPAAEQIASDAMDCNTAAALPPIRTKSPRPSLDRSSPPTTTSSPLINASSPVATPSAVPPSCPAAASPTVLAPSSKLPGRLSQADSGQVDSSLNG